jgi:hypothetical protein
MVDGSKLSQEETQLLSFLIDSGSNCTTLPKARYLNDYREITPPDTVETADGAQIEIVGKGTLVGYIQLDIGLWIEFEMRNGFHVPGFEVCIIVPNQLHRGGLGIKFPPHPKRTYLETKEGYVFPLKECHNSSLPFLELRMPIGSARKKKGYNHRDRSETNDSDEDPKEYRTFRSGLTWNITRSPYKSKKEDSDEARSGMSSSTGGRTRQSTAYTAEQAFVEALRSTGKLLVATISDRTVATISDRKKRIQAREDIPDKTPKGLIRTTNAAACSHPRPSHQPRNKTMEIHLFYLAARHPCTKYMTKLAKCDCNKI